MIEDSYISEEELKNKLKSNFIFKFFLFFNVHYIIISSIISISFYLIGLIIFSVFYSPYEFLSNLIVYIFILAIFFGLNSFGWYVKQFPKTITEIHSIFFMSKHKYIEIFNNIFLKWASKNWLLIISSIFFILIGTAYIVYLWNTPVWDKYLFNLKSSTYNYVFMSYFIFLASICGIILGCGTLGYFLSAIYISILCKNPINVIYNYKVKELQNLFIGLEIWGAIAISLYVFLTFNNLEFAQLILLILGLILLFISYIFPQFTYHISSKKAKEELLNTLNKNISSAVNNILNLNYKPLRNEFIGQNIEILKYYSKIKTWLWDTKIIVKLIASLISPIISFFIKKLLGF